MISTQDAERNTLKFVVVSDKKVSEMEVKLDKISVPDKIQLHKQIEDVIYSDLLHATVKVTRLQSLVDKMEIKLKHEKVENKANLIQIKKLQGDIISLGTEPNNVQVMKKFLEEKDNTIQVLEKNLKVPNTEHVQYSELFTVHEEKEKVYQEMMDYKGKLLKMQEEKYKWETEKAKLIAQIARLNKDQNDEKEVMEELMN